MARCRAVHCEDAKQCLSPWPAPGSALNVFAREARDRVLAKMMDSA